MLTIIKISDKVYPCRTTMGAIVRFKRLTGLDIKELKPDDLENFMIFLWCCVVSACNADKVEFLIPVEDFMDHLDPEQLNQWSEGLAEDTEKKS